MMDLPSRWAEAVGERIEEVLGLLNYPVHEKVTITAPPILDDTCCYRRVSSCGYAMGDKGPFRLGVSVNTHRYQRHWTSAHGDKVVRSTIWSLLFSRRPERKFLALAISAWVLSPNETSFERALVKFRLKQLEYRLTDGGEYGLWEIVRQLPRAILRVLLGKS